jgi:nicotinate-nucleotide adenylyltransferase
MLNGQIRVGIYGGTFAPVHNGHLAAARAFIEQMQLDILYVIPARVPPHKQIDASDDPVHRYKMCELAFWNEQKVLVSDIELKREGKSYTVDTLRALAAPDRRLFLLMGTDMMLTLGEWRAPEEIFKLCYPVYARREKDPIIEARIVAKNNEYLAKYGKIVRRLMLDTVELASTDIRSLVQNGEAFEHLVPEGVAAYIKKHGLYRGEHADA